MKYVVTVPEDVARISRTYLPIKATISFFMDAYDEEPPKLPKMPDQISFTLSWRAFLECGRASEYARFPPQGG